MPLLFQLSGVATYPSGKEAERKIDIRIKVLDENDNAPKFGFIQPGEVKELSPVGKTVWSYGFQEKNKHQKLFADNVQDQRWM